MSPATRGGTGTWRMAPPRVRQANAHQTASRELPTHNSGGREGAGGAGEGITISFSYVKTILVVTGLPRIRIACHQRSLFRCVSNAQ